MQYTVPYECESQPIEKCWAVVKNYAASQHTSGRTPKQLRAEVMAGFYGLSGVRPAVKRTNCAAWINHAKKEVNSWMWKSRMREAFGPDAKEADVSVDNMTDAIIKALSEKMRLGDEEEEEEVDSDEPVMDAIPDVQEH